jgi:hypothetical protein
VGGGHICSSLSQFLTKLVNKSGGNMYLLEPKTQILTNLVKKRRGNICFMLKSVFDKIGEQKWEKYMLYL